MRFGKDVRDASQGQVFHASRGYRDIVTLVHARDVLHLFTFVPDVHAGGFWLWLRCVPPSLIGFGQGRSTF